MPTQEQIQNLIEQGLAEDLGSGDVTTDSILTGDPVCEANITAKQDLVLCGLNIVRALFLRLDPDTRFSGGEAGEGARIQRGQHLLTLRARAGALLKGERLALNILQRLCGIATLTAEFVQAAGPVTILDTRKTTPGLRAFEKYAVKCGGAANHRFGLFDQVLIKDNHIKIAGGIPEAVRRVRANEGYSGPIEVETTSLEEVDQALEAGVDIIMLDNMSLETMQEAVARVAGRARIEVSGNMSLERLRELAGVGVDCVSVGALTHSAPSADISMNIKIDSNADRGGAG